MKSKKSYAEVIILKKVALDEISILDVLDKNKDNDQCK